MSAEGQKKIAVINDFSGFGRCSLTVSIPIISAAGIQCCPLPTSVFSNHTAYDSFYCTDFTRHMLPYINEWKKLGLSFDGILSGFLGSPEQIDIVKDFFDSFKTEHTVIVVDPIMGDNGRLYATYSSRLAEKMCSLLPYADIITPNLTEACILTGTVYRSDMSENCLEELCAALSDMGPEKVVVTGLEDGEKLGNYVYEKGKEPVMVNTPKIGCPRAGTGDVFSSIIAADAVLGLDFIDSVRRASDFISKALMRTVELNIPPSDGVCFEEFLKEL